MILTFGEDTSESSLIFSNGVGGDQKVIHINVKPALVEFLTENLIHHCLEYGQWIAKSEEHDKWFKAALICDKGSFPFIAFLDLNIIVSPVYNEFGKDLCILDLINEFGDQREGITVLYGQGIEFPIVLNRSEITQLLFDEEEGGRNWQFRGTDATSLEVFFQEFIKFLLF